MVDSELSACSIRRVLLADVTADLFQFEPDGGYRRTAGPEVFAGEVSFLPQSRAIAMALLPFRNPITDATGCLGGIAIHMCTWSVSFQNLTLLPLHQRTEDRTQFRMWPKIAFRRRLGTNTT